MIMIEVDHDVSRKLAETAKKLGITRNRVLRKLLKLDNPIIFHTQKNKIKNGIKVNSDLIFNNIQDELIPHIVKILYENGGKAAKTVVENEIFMLFQNEFEKPYYNETVSHGVPRWKHNIAWAKERAKQRHGFIKGAVESDYGIWELTAEGITYYEKSH
jgi:hypothetical protein